MRTSGFFEFVFFVALATGNSLTSGFPARVLMWNRSSGNFESLSNFSTFGAEWNNYLRKSRELETHDFRKEVVKISGYQAANIIFYENKKITGVCGDLWNILAEYLNFTLEVVTPDDRTYIKPGEKMFSENRLTEMLVRNDIQVIAMTAYAVVKTDRITFTTPMWITSHKLYIRPETKFINAWMIRMFSRQVWCLILLMFVLLSVVGYTIQRKSIKVSGDENSEHGLNDHLFHTFATFCSQGDVPESLYRRIKILGFSKKMFAWLLLSAVSSNLISSISHQGVYQPFQNFENLINDTKYNIIAFEGTAFHSILERDLHKLMSNSSYEKRVNYTKSIIELYQEGCSKEKKFAILNSEDVHRSFAGTKCDLVPMGKSYYTTWISAAVSKNFKYRKAFNLGILRIKELGILSRLIGYWNENADSNSNLNVPLPVNLKQISMILVILCIGILTSGVIFVLENIVYLYHCNRNKVHSGNTIAFEVREHDFSHLTNRN
ncbi:glutamate receptor 4-like [Venturia canescens]|uniref:glutamate receptor 4-like n=1 Tax=Venturia canescens TaxID=32260 RepID=UPI001C9C8042|nr:glutamate receptor 4-like [Venturia canescens]